MKSRPIIFRGGMVRAIREGRKTQTRRLMKPQPTRSVNAWTDDSEPGEIVVFQGAPCRLSESKGRDKRALGELTPTAIRCPYGRPGDELWVRETCDLSGWPESWDPTADYETTRAASIIYRADEGATPRFNGSWCSPLLMPRWASRLTLVVRSVRVERLSAITDEDAIAEGVESAGLFRSGWKGLGGHHVYGFARDAFMQGFRAMHKLAPDADPWLWVVGFEVKP